MSSDVEKGLAEFLGREWEEPVQVENARPVTAGARRRNVLFDAVRAGNRLELVATIVPNPAIQLTPVELEAASLRLAEAVGCPAPHVHAVCTEASFVGGPFFVTERVEGVTIPRQVLRQVESTPGLGARLARDCGQALARLHSADESTAPAGLARPSQAPAEHSLAMLEPLLAGLLQPSPALALGFRWLARHLPAAPARLAVLHGDFRNGNIIVGEEGLAAALDWEACRIGDPMEDLAWLCVRMWRFRSDSLEVGGFGRRDDLRDGYREAGGEWNEESFHWWKTLGTLRWGLGLAGQAAAHIDGSVPSIVMAGSGRRVAELEYDTLMLVSREYRA